MNTYIQRTKDLILDYLGKAQQTEAKITEGRAIYNEEAMKREEARLRENLASMRKATEAEIERYHAAAVADAKSWGKLDGTQLTDDVKLLQGDVSVEQFKSLVERYKDNYTMLEQLRGYGERKNREAEKQARENGERGIFVGDYPMDGFSGVNQRIEEADAIRDKAEYFLNVADGTGMDAFALSFARGTADRELEAWGESKEAPSANADDITRQFVEAWGFNS